MAGIDWSPLPGAVHRLVAESVNSVLLESSRIDAENQRSLLFLKPKKILIARTLAELPGIFAAMEASRAEGCYVAGYFGYECGYGFERFAAYEHDADALPLVWLGVYERALAFDHLKGRFEDEFVGLEFPTAALRAEVATTECAELALGISATEYAEKIRQIQEYITAGESYQVNFTDAVGFASPLPALELYESLLRQQSVSFGAWLNLGESQILSFSPELFFRVEGRRIVTRPMKGTMRRGLDVHEDAAAAERLRQDEKNRSEHIMIVDLLRNDLGRICRMGSVRVEDLMRVERYQTLLQMTSTIAGELRAEAGYAEIFRSMFPCGSVTGAPKIRTMEIIRKLEWGPRGVYTGAIGYIAPNGNSTFNVAIRTLVLRDGCGVMGVGGGIVADSVAEEEHRECLLKASFLTRRRDAFQLIETMRWDGEFRLLGLHLERLRESAEYFDFRFRLDEVRSALVGLVKTFNTEKIYRVRLLLAAAGAVKVESAEFIVETALGHVAIAAERTNSTDVFLRHKTTRRDMYDTTYRKARSEGLEDFIFLNERGEITEGAISNLFVELDGKLLTPPLSCGVLPGVYRRHLLETDQLAEEQVLRVEDLQRATAVYLCNSLRGLRRVQL